MGPEFFTMPKRQGGRRKEGTEVSDAPASRRSTHLDLQAAGVSGEFQLKRRWPELGKGASVATPLRHGVRRRRATWSQQPSCRAT